MAISLCMIVKDEADNLPSCLESVRDIVHELIVVDTGSTDATRDIAAEYGAQVYDIPWDNDFAAARNAALQAATGDWVLVLDADEMLVPHAAAALAGLDRGEPWAEVPAAQVVMVNLIRLEVGAPQAPYNLVSRFFRRLPGITFQRPYHETVDDSVAPPATATPVAGGYPGLGGHSPHGLSGTVVAQRQKFARAQTIMEGYLEEHPTDSYLLNKLAALYLEQGHTADALAMLDRAIAQPEVDDLTGYELHYHRGLALREQHPTQAEAAYRQALAQPVSPRLKLGAYLNLGSLQKARGQLADAAGQFQQAVAIDPAFALAHYNLGVVYRAQEQLEESIAAYQRAIDLDPDYAEAHQNLGVALFKTGQVELALEAFHRAFKIYQQTDPLRANGLLSGLQSLGLPPALLAEAHFE
jgi:Tfp pilus assembly protein PilF